MCRFVSCCYKIQMFVSLFFFKCSHQIYAGAVIKCYFILEWAWGQGGGGQKNGLTKVSLHKPNYSAKIRNIAIAIFNALNN